MMPCENICRTAPPAPSAVAEREAEQDEAHVADARVADHELQVALPQRDRRRIENSDHREDDDPVAPQLEASGSRFIATRSAPYAPSFITIPASSIEPAVGAAT